RVLEAAQSLGYTGNELARGLRQQTTRTIGLIISDILNPFHAHVASGLEQEAAQHGYSAILCTSTEDVEKERRSLELLRRHQVCGVVLEPTEGSRVEVEALVKAGIPVVEVDRMSGAQGAATVLSDNIGGAASAARHLLSLGHHRIATVAGDPQLISGRERLEGLRMALAASGIPLPDHRVVTGRYTSADGYQAALELLARPGPRPTALFLANIEMTLGTLRALKELGLRVPEDISVISFDDASWAPLVSPPLSVVTQDPVGLGRIAAQIIINAVSHVPDTVPAVQRLPTTLVLRRSCGPPNDGSLRAVQTE
ncbi:LacI family DNA-binding transcriptional regulator, partial [Deinococcus sp.]|uniref:LacI family DNA-binding transcriptional regulator n=1 Tax=Deinococcus sp. TaxID=47478 RepID=UPI002869DA43